MPKNRKEIGRQLWKLEFLNFTTKACMLNELSLVVTKHNLQIEVLVTQTILFKFTLDCYANLILISCQAKGEEVSISFLSTYSHHN